MPHISAPLIGGGVAALLLVGLLWWIYRHLHRDYLPSPFAEVPVRLARAGEWEFRYHISGRGPHLVLLHGIGANLFCWRWILPLLNTHYTVIAPDLPGFGGSSKLPGANYGLDEQVQRLKTFLDYLGISKAVMVGNSMGGNIALWFSLAYPDRSLGTVVIAPATSAKLVPIMAAKLHWLSGPISMVLPKWSMHWAHNRTVSKRERVDRDRVEETFRTYGRNAAAVRSFLLATESIRDPRLPAKLNLLRSKVLILWGAKDRMVPRIVIEDLKAALPEAHVEIHHSGGHHLQEDEPEWVTEKIDAFVESRLD